MMMMETHFINQKVFPKNAQIDLPVKEEQEKFLYFI
jgi:hypothetical protein